MSASMKRLLKHRNILLLQGKMGTFFCRFASFLMDGGRTVHKINFNAGDAFFYCYKDMMTNYRGQLHEFDDFLKAVIAQHDIDAVVCFNDCRPYHMIAKDVCALLGVSFFVFEEGYLRPDYITLEEHGINGYSRLNPAMIDSFDKANDRPKYTANRFWRLCVASIVYYLVVFLGGKKYPYYSHYRGLSISQEMISWMRAPIRKAMRYLPDRLLQQRLIKHSSQQYFLVSLQVHNDSQITHHSDYQDVTEFIEIVLKSFAVHAPKHTQILFKHHPLDRGHRDYKAFIQALSDLYQIQGRAHYGCDMHLPSLIRHSIGMITVNSTTGLQSIYHKKPTKVMGRALYDIDGLTDQKPLDEFWTDPVAPDHEFYLKFREYLIEQTQLNGSFYGASPWALPYIHPQEVGVPPEKDS
ncbi:capsular biosynthesis protein [Moraxella canis]|uniref:Capsular biosynthesis protein n=1 Tax=Moraxella canis TaxID=90239 RepID=A0ABZ0WZQ1_9GAMM|nr:capsular biosynthesis protein [Moraxella canis]WQE04738.1 capsular biosynthesis protein [Moraxella canis]